jgi:hypothetical protein
MIKAPVNNKIPLEGSWKVSGYEKLNGTTIDDKELDPWIGKVFQFFQDEIIIGNEVYIKPSYKVKTVNSKQVFMYEYGLDSSVLGIESQDVMVISIFSEDKLLYDIVKYNNELFVDMNNILFKLKFWSKEKSLESSLSMKTNKEIDEKEGSDKRSDKKSGVLLGLRYTEEEKDGRIDNVKYRTLWIDSNYSPEFPMIQCNYLLVPRMNGFWKLGATRNYGEGVLFDLLYTNSLGRKDNTNKSSNSTNKNPRIISFVGNDYLISEYSIDSRLNNIEYSKIQVLPMDGVNKSKGIKLQDIAGDAALTAMMNSAKSFLSSMSETDIENFKTTPNDEEFFLVRRNGHWILNGRLYGKDSYNNKLYKNYDIIMMPPKELVSYDDLKVSWNNIKEKNPDAIDAYTSPNEDIAIIITKDSVYIYSVSKGKLGEKYMGKVKLKNNETVIMSEWATTENFVNAWRKTIKSNSGSEVKE